MVSRTASSAKRIERSRLIAFSFAVALLAAGCWWFAAASRVTEEGASRQLTVAAEALAAAFDAPLSRFAQLTSSFRPSDFAAIDRLAMTARQIRLQGAIPYASATFLATASGRVVAASAPFPSGEAEVGRSTWFQHAFAQTGGVLAVQRVDAAWLRAGSTVLVTRTVADEAGHAVGVIGAIFGLDDLRSLLRPAWIPESLSTRLVAADGVAILQTEAPPESGPASAQGVQAWLPRLLLALDRLAGRPTTLSAMAEVLPIRATVQASLPSEVVIRNAWKDPSEAALGVALIAGAVICLLLAAVPVRRRESDTSQAAIYGADWAFELDSKGILTSATGFVPPSISCGIGKPFVQVLQETAGQNDPACAYVASAIRAHVRQDALDVRLQDAEAGNHVHRLSLAPVRSGGFRGTARDVSDETAARVAAEAATAEAGLLRTQADAVAQDRDRVLAAVGHDVRTPMNSILGICALLLDEGHLEDEHRVWIERIGASCEALLAMLNGLLEIASGAGGAELHPAEVDVAALVEEVVGVLAPQAYDKGLVLKTRFDDAVQGSWMVDPTRLRQVLFNLASNAIKYTGSGSVEIRASAITDADGQTSIRLAVSDTGPGIAPEERTQIFERFRRGRGEASDGREGLGLGLALCRENATLMGGSLTVESSVGVGSEFTFEFRAERPPAERQAPAYRGRTALVVGFDEAEGRRIASHLARMGLSVETAEDGFLANGLAERTAARSGTLDAVVLNAAMTGMQPDAFLMRLRSTSYGSRSAVVVVGPLPSGEEAADAVLPASADARQAAAAVASCLAQVPALDCIDPAAPLPGAARVLVVEDNKVNQSLLAAALSRRGFTTFVADNGEAAVRQATAGMFDAILMDIQMPGIDGLEATRRIRAMGGRMATMPIIALSALTGAVVQKRCAEVGMTARAVKPVNLDRLAADLRRWIDEARTALPTGETDAEPDDMSESTVADGTAEVSIAFLESMVLDIGLDRTRACIREFLSDLTARCSRLGELLPGWEADAIMRICHDLGGRAGELGALGLAEAMEDLADQAERGERDDAARTIQRIEASVGRAGASMTATLARLAQKSGEDGRQAA